MKQPKRIADLATLTFLTRGGGLLLGVVSAVLMARAVGADGRGRIAIVFALVTLGQYVGAQGLSHGQFRVWSRKVASRDVLIGTGWWLSAATGVVAGGLMWALFAIGQDSFLSGMQATDLAFLSAALPFWIHLILIRDVLVMKDQIMRANLALLAGSAVRVAGVVVLYAVGELTVDTALAMVVVSIIVPWAAMCRMAGFTLRMAIRPPSWRVLRREAAVGGELAPAFFLQRLNLRLDVLFVAQFAGLEAAGIYAVAAMLSELAWVATDSLTYTVRERQANAEEREAADITAKTVRMNVIIAFGLAVAIAAATPVFVGPLLGEDFTSATGVVWALVPATVAMAPWRTLTIVLVRLTRPWIVPLVALGAVALGVGLCAWWAQGLGAAGAGLACSAGYTAGAVASAVVFLRITERPVQELIPGPEDFQRLVSLVSGRRRQLQAALAR